MLPFLAFVFGTALVGGAALLFMPKREEAIDRRLQELMSDRDNAEPAKPRWQTLIGVFKRIGDKVPRSPKEMGTLRLRLVQAGYRRDEALTIFFGIRVLFAVVLFLLLSSSLIIRPNTLVALGGLCMGYLLPGMILARLAKRRAHRVRMSLADALDLLVVSVEAGLGLDQALTRVGTELAFAYPELADELKLINLELRAGKPRAEALRNLADRTGVDDLSSLVTMLIQTDKFGTSVAQSLRVYSETLRTKRRQRAEEAAAKTGVKMVFPLVLCIFPSIWVVTIGPAAIKFVTVLFPMVENMKK
ncbi:MAG TPA: type II secretion system F family protein [Vicinamibacterales bacterium]|jgi:tight adherence protein C|nr:type II secretion system F family protein [Vicinamibacterales bacterium]